MTYGLTPQGFVRKRLDVIKQEREAAYRGRFGNDILTDGDSVFGEIIGIESEREAELWELMEAVYFSAFPDTASGVALRYSAAITGTSALPSTYSEVTCVAAGTPGTVLPVGRIVSVPGTGARFVSTVDVTIGAGGTVSMPMRAEVKGPVQAEANTVTKIETPVSGWASATNPAAAATGRAEEKDTELRQRRAESLVIAKGGTIRAIESRLQKLPGVAFAALKENRTGWTDANGLPPKSIQAFVVGGEDQVIGDLLWEVKPAGIETAGSVSVTVFDSFGGPQVVRFNRGSDVPIYLVVELTAETGYPADGDAKIKAALVAYGATMGNGDDVVNWRLVATLGGIPGIVSLVIKQGTAPGPSSTANISLTPDQLATFDLSRISVVRTGP